eukprot:Selendium_serpulae@DN4290_c0_g1_i2.p1
MDGIGEHETDALLNVVHQNLHDAAAEVNVLAPAAPPPAPVEQEIWLEEGIGHPYPETVSGGQSIGGAVLPEGAVGGFVGPALQQIQSQLQKIPRVPNAPTHLLPPTNTDDQMGVGLITGAHVVVFVAAIWFFSRQLYRENEAKSRVIQVLFAMTCCVSVSMPQLLMLELLQWGDPAVRFWGWQVDIVVMLALVYFLLPCALVYSVLLSRATPTPRDTENISRSQLVVGCLIFLPLLWAAFAFSGRFIEIPWHTVSTEHLLARVGVCGVAVVSSLAGYAAINFPYQNVSLFYSIVHYHELAEIECLLLNVLAQLAEKKAQCQEYESLQQQYASHDMSVKSYGARNAPGRIPGCSASRRNSALLSESQCSIQMTPMPSRQQFHHHHNSLRSPRASFGSPRTSTSHFVASINSQTIPEGDYGTSTWQGGWAPSVPHTEAGSLSMSDSGGVDPRSPSFDCRSDESPAGHGELQHLYRAGLCFLGKRTDGLQGRFAQLVASVVGGNAPPVNNPLASQLHEGDVGLQGSILSSEFPSAPTGQNSYPFFHGSGSGIPPKPLVLGAKLRRFRCSQMTCTLLSKV